MTTDPRGRIGFPGPLQSARHASGHNRGGQGGVAPGTTGRGGEGSTGGGSRSATADVRPVYRVERRVKQRRRDRIGSPSALVTRRRRPDGREHAGEGRCSE